jgi:TPR repeat protein
VQQDSVKMPARVYILQSQSGRLYYGSTTEAVKWYRKAAEQGDDTAQFNLGNQYARGEAAAGKSVCGAEGDATGRRVRAT